MKRFKKSLSVLIAVTMIAWSLGVPLATLLPVANAAVTSSRLSGADRYATAVEISKEMYTTSASAVLATGENYPDALAGVELADYVGSPLLLTQKNSLTTAAKDELSRLGVTTVYLLGGTSAISSSVETTLSGLGYTVTRLSGADRYATAVEIAGQAYTASSVTTAFVATGLNFPDALAAAGSARANSAPLLLVKENSIPSATANYLATLTSLSNIYVIGGTAVVSSSVATSLGSYATVTRVSGANRYATATEVAKQFYTASSLTEVITATGENFPDALAGGVLSAKDGVPIVLAKANSLPSETSTYLITCSNVTTSYILGGTAVVSDSVVSSVVSAIGGAVPGATLNVAVDPATPVAGTIYVDTTVPAGSANNVITKVKFTAGANNTTISGLKVTKYGTASNGATDIARVKVYDGATRLGTRVLVTNSASFTFAPVISLSAGASKTLDLVLDLTGAAASVTRTVALGVAAATDVTVTVGGTAIVAGGTYPAVGNYMTIAQGTFGSITVAAGVAPPATTPRIGEDDRVLANWVISAGANEDLVLESITIDETGTAADGDITDIKLTGSDLGTATSFVNGRAVIVLNKAMTRGSSLTIQMTGDITSGVTRTIWPMLLMPDAVVAKGATSGVYFTGPAANAGPAAATAAITGGVMAVTPNVASPTDDLVNAPVPQTVGIFDVKGTGENVVVQTATLNLTHAAGIVTGYNAALFDEAGGLASNIVAIPGAGVAGQAFNMGWTVAPATTQKLYVKAYTSTLTAAEAGGNITVGVGINGFAGVGETSGAASVAPAAGFNLPAVTYRHSGSLQFALDTNVAPINQAALTSTAENYWTAFKVIATREDVTATSIQFDNIAAATTQPFVTCSLYDRATDGTLANLDTQTWNAAAGGYACIAGACGNVVFNNIDMGAGLTIPMGAANAKVLAVKCSVSGTATAADAPELDVTVNPTATGAVSGQAPQAITLAGLVTGAQARGLHTIFDTAAGGVLYVTPNAFAPSGDISRSSIATLGIWDFTAKGAAIAFDNLGANAEVPLVFTSFTGGIWVNAASTNFRLVDADTGTVYAASNGGVVATTATTVTFDDADLATGAAQLAILQDQTVSVKLQENITNPTNYPQYTQFQFGFANAAAINTEVDGAAVAVVNNAGGLVDYPASGVEARCPEVRIQ